MYPLGAVNSPPQPLKFLVICKVFMNVYCTYCLELQSKWR